MSLLEWILKHGKVGWIAKWSAQTYKTVRQKMPDATEAEIFEGIYNAFGAARVIEGKRGSGYWRYTLTNQESIDRRRSSPYRNLRDVAMSIVISESDRPMPHDLRFFTEINGVVEGILDKEVPEWRDTPAKPSPTSRPLVEAQQRLPHNLHELQGGISVNRALELFLNASNKPDTIFITEVWIRPKLR